MRLREARIRRACCPVQAGEVLAPERVDPEVVDTLPCNCEVAPSPLVTGSETGVGWSSKCISAVIWQRKHVVLVTGGFVNMSVYCRPRTYICICKRVTRRRARPCVEGGVGVTSGRYAYGTVAIRCPRPAIVNIEIGSSFHSYNAPGLPSSA